MAFHSTDDDTFEGLARHLAALKKGLAALDEHYNEVDARPQTLPRSVPSSSNGSTRVLQSTVKPYARSEVDRIFPHPTTFAYLSSKSRSSFVYGTQMAGRHLLFNGKTEDNQRICIKFVRRYGDTVHAWCAREGFAPNLIAFNSLPGGWYMVVMELLDDSWTPLIFTNKEDHSEGLKNKLCVAFEKMHSASMVHGDVRDTNVMVKLDGQCSFMLVDFDWAGIGRQVKYPKLINNAGISRPEGVTDGLEILPEHDIAMLNRLFR